MAITLYIDYTYTRMEERTNSVKKVSSLSAQFYCPRNLLWQMKLYSFLLDVLNIGVKRRVLVRQVVLQD